jgi:hypothetical protein
MWNVNRKERSNGEAKPGTVPEWPMMQTGIAPDGRARPQLSCVEGTAMAEKGISWRRDAEKALDEARQNRKRVLVDFTAAPM